MPKHSATILVIDDEEVVRRTAKAALERSGYEIVLAEDGAAGIRIFKALGDKVLTGAARFDNARSQRGEKCYGTFNP